MHKYQKAVTASKAGKSVKQLQFKQKLANAPLETIHVTGRFVNTPNGIAHLPDEVSVLGIRFVLEPGVQEVPSPIARAYQQMQAQKRELQKKEALMSGKGAPQGTYQHAELMQKLSDL
jgi:hypothetical protein